MHPTLGKMHPAFRNAPDSPKNAPRFFRNAPWKTKNAPELFPWVHFSIKIGVLSHEKPWNCNGFRAFLYPLTTYLTTYGMKRNANEFMYAFCFVIMVPPAIWARRYRLYIDARIPHQRDGRKLITDPPIYSVPLNTESLRDNVARKHWEMEMYVILLSWKWIWSSWQRRTYLYGAGRKGYTIAVLRECLYILMAFMKAWRLICIYSQNK